MSATKLIAIAGLTLSLSLAACERSPDPSRAQGPQPAPADNSARNAHDPDSAKTPLDQSNDPAAIKITAEIRRAIIEDPAMSGNAQN